MDTAMELAEAPRATDAELIRSAVDYLETEAGRFEDGPQEGWLPNWYIGRLVQLDALEAAVKFQRDKLLREINAERRGLAWRWGQAFKACVGIVHARQRVKKKSVTFDTGDAGWRKTKLKLGVDNLTEAVKWAEENVPSAVRKDVLLTPLTEYFKRTGEVPIGMHVIKPQEKFFPDVEQKHFETQQILQLADASEEVIDAE